MSGTPMDIKNVMENLPHRYPFLLIDRVLDFKAGEYLTALKNISIDEPVFSGHFPGAPIFPGVMIVEALAQASGILAFKTADRTPEDGKLFFLTGVNKAKFRKPVVPGDQLILKVELLVTKRNLWKFKGEAFVDDKLVASAEVTSAESST